MFYIAGTYKGAVQPFLLRKDIRDLGFNDKAGFSFNIDIDDYSKLEIIDSNSLQRLNKNSQSISITSGPKIN